MNVVLIFLVFLIFVILIVVAIAKSGIYAAPTEVQSKNQTTSQRTQNVPINTFTTLPVWSKPTPYDAKGSGQCTAYTFKGQKFVPAAPSYEILNNNETDKFISTYNYYGTDTPLQSCIDVDQLFASTISHECLNPQGISAGAGCILTVNTGVKQPDGTYQLYNPGQKVPLNTIEGDPTISSLNNKFYASCVPNYLSGNIPNTVYCQGSVGVVIPNFMPQTTYDQSNTSNECLAAITDNVDVQKDGSYPVGATGCDLANQSEIFRMIRYTLNSDYTLTQSNKGNLAAIIHRATGFYLAPKLTFITQKPTEIIEGVVVNSVTSYYDFDKPIIEYGEVTDKAGNPPYKDHIKLVLINPKYDIKRNGVYWLLQNQIVNPTVDSNTTDILKFLGKGVYPNQYNYKTQYPAGMAVQSQYWLNSWNLFPDVSGVSSKPTETIENDSKISVADACTRITNTNTSQIYRCYGNAEINLQLLLNPTLSSFKSITYTPGTVSNVPLNNITPQQIVYVPDFRLLPNNTTDINRLWTYLVNSYSINILSDNTPILTPYRSKLKYNLKYNVVLDNKLCDVKNELTENSKTILKDCKNVFLQLESYTQGDNTMSDSQFISYGSYIQQIQTPILKDTPGCNPSYSKKSNPFNIV